MVCNNCGEKTTEGGKFCSKCGSPLTGDLQQLTNVSEPVENPESDRSLATDWDGTEVIKYPREVVDNPEEAHEPPPASKTPEKIFVKPEATQDRPESPAARKFSFNNLGNAALQYIKRNWLFIAIIFVIWLLTGAQDYINQVYKVPVIGRLLAKIALFVNTGHVGYILRYFTAAYNGPVAFGMTSGLTPYTFLVALTAKSAYLLAMTGVVFPSIKELMSNRSAAVVNYRNSGNSLVNSFRSAANNLHRLGFLLCGCGAALAISNLLSRNGKFDKSFILILLSFVMFKGLSQALPSALDVIVRKLMQVTTLIVPQGNVNAGPKYSLIRSGTAVGFLLAVLVGMFGEKAGYILGFLSIAAGLIIAVAVKEKA